MDFADIARRFRIDRPEHFRLSDHKSDETYGLDIERAEAKDMLADGIKRLEVLQQKLYAYDRWSVLIVLQAMDAAGKDGVIKHVMTGFNPQGCEVHAFKAPSEEELAHDFLWRAARSLPSRGRISIFNRSYYEDVLVVRVHPELLAQRKLPPKLDDKDVWPRRFEAIRAFERQIAGSGTCILKFFLNISPEEQRKRFLDRLDQPDKHWKFSMSDVRERALWPKYMAAYEDMIRSTSSAEALWFVVPSDRKWFSRLVVAATLVDTLERLGLEYPKVEGEALKEMEKTRRALESEKS